MPATEGAGRSARKQQRRREAEVEEIVDPGQEEAPALPEKPKKKQKQADTEAAAGLPKKRKKQRRERVVAHELDADAEDGFVDVEGHDSDGDQPAADATAATTEAEAEPDSADAAAEKALPAWLANPIPISPAVEDGVPLDEAAGLHDEIRAIMEAQGYTELFPGVWRSRGRAHLARRRGQVANARSSRCQDGRRRGSQCKRRCCRS